MRTKPPRLSHHGWGPMCIGDYTVSVLHIVAVCSHKSTLLLHLIRRKYQLFTGSHSQWIGQIHIDRYIFYKITSNWIPWSSKQKQQTLKLPLHCFTPWEAFTGAARVVVQQTYWPACQCEDTDTASIPHTQIFNSLQILVCLLSLRCASMWDRSLRHIPLQD